MDGKAFHQAIPGYSSTLASPSGLVAFEHRLKLSHLQSGITQAGSAVQSMGAAVGLILLVYYITWMLTYRCQRNLFRLRAIKRLYAARTRSPTKDLAALFGHSDLRDHRAAEAERGPNGAAQTSQERPMGPRDERYQNRGEFEENEYGSELEGGQHMRRPRPAGEDVFVKDQNPKPRGHL